MRTANYINKKQVKLKGKTDKSTTMLGHFNHPPPKVDRKTEQKVSTYTKESIEQHHQTSVSNQIGPITEEYTSQTSDCKRYTKIDYILRKKKPE